MSRTRTITLTVGSLAAGALLATGVTGMAQADDRSDAPSTGSSAIQVPGSTDAGPGGERRGPGGGKHGMRGGPMGEALHGEAVVRTADGTIATVRHIQGEVTAVSADSITVKAEDGYSATFAVTGDTKVRTGLPQRDGNGPEESTDTIADVSVGDVARVGGTVDGSAATADRVHAMTAEEAATMEQQREQHRAEHEAAQGSSSATQSS